LIELLVVVSISAILMAISVPMFSDFIARKSVDAQISAFGDAVRRARAEALKRNMPVTICPTSNPDAAIPVCSGTSDASRGWASGWVIFTDWGKARVIDSATDTVISRQSSIANSGGIVPANSSYTLRFFPNGISVGNQGGSFVFKPKNDPDNTKLQKTIFISSEGVTRLATSAD
jgi:type IV fimbrial biogenesis protein FimT